jgi:hypothetical protein
MRLSRAGALALLLAMVVACSGSPRSRPPAAAGHGQAGGVAVGSITDISQGPCGQQGAEVEAAAWHDDVYAAWICLVGHRAVDIGFARSQDGGRTWSVPVVMPGSSGGWDPAVAVAPEGTLYVSFMVSASRRSYPVVDVSQDQGRTFPRSTRLVPALPGNFGDRDFIAAGAAGLAYLTWDYGPSAAEIRAACERGGSCSFTAGDLNIVIQKSTDYGQHWGPPEHVSPGFPAGGADLAPLLIGPGGQVDVTYQAYKVLNRDSLTFGPSNIYFTSSGDGGATWSRPVLIGGGAGTISTRTWWIDGAITSDAAGNLYITWDTQGASSDAGWLSYSTNGGQAWSPPIRVTPDNADAAHIVQAASGTSGTVYVGWLSDSSPSGYAQYLRVFSLARGWLGAPVQVSRQFGLQSVWPGDTFGIATLSASSLVLAWGSALGSRSQIYAAPVSFTP